MTKECKPTEARLRRACLCMRGAKRPAGGQEQTSFTTKGWTLNPVTSCPYPPAQTVN